MKKIFSLIVIFSLSVIVLTGCNKTYSKSISVKLKADPSKSSIWEYEITEQGIVQVYEDNDFDCDEDGCSGYQKYKIEGLSEGETTVTFKYIYDNEVKKREVYKIEVNKDLKLSSN